MKSQDESFQLLQIIPGKALKFGGVIGYSSQCQPVGAFEILQRVTQTAVEPPAVSEIFVSRVLGMVVRPSRGSAGSLGETDGGEGPVTKQ